MPDLLGSALPPPSLTKIQRYRRLASGASDTRAAIATIKHDLDLRELAIFVESVRKFAKYKGAIALQAFPRSTDEFSNDPLLPPGDIEREIVWLAAVIGAFVPELEFFIKERDKFFRCYMNGDAAGAFSALDDIELNIGSSFWLIESRINAHQRFSGLEAQKSYARSTYSREENSKDFVDFITYFVSYRAEGAVSSAAFRRTLGYAVESAPNDLRQYVEAKLLPVDGGTLSSWVHRLARSEVDPIVDRYNMFARVVRAYASKVAIRRSSPVFAVFQEALRIVNLPFDAELAPAMLAMGVLEFSTTYRPDQQLISIFDNYTVGRYEEAFNEAIKIILLYPDRFDLYETVAKCLLRLNSREDLLGLSELAEQIIRSARHVISKSSAYAESYELLSKASLLLAAYPVSAILTDFLRRYGAAQANEDGSATIENGLCVRFGDPWCARSLISINGSRSEAIVAVSPTSSAIRLQALLLDRANSLNQRLDALKKLGLPHERERFFGAMICAQSGDVQKAEALYKEVLTSNFLPSQFDSAKELCLLFLNENRLGDAALLIASSYINNPLSHILLRIEEVLDAIERAPGNMHLYQAALPVIYDIYSRNFGPARDGLRSDAYEDFLILHGAARPSELASLLANEEMLAAIGGRAIITYFLRYVCIPRIMDASIAFEGSHDLLRERIAVCQILTEIDAQNAGIYEDEIRSLTQEIVVGEGIQHVEESRIYVDEDGVRRSLSKTMPENFHRYINMISAISEKNDIKSFLDRIVQISDTTGAKLMVQIPASEEIALFESIVRDFRDQFVSSTFHGLAAYLSGRIRHGFFSNRLRGPLEVMHLATQRDGKTDRYRPNVYWAGRGELAAADQEWLGDRLATFIRSIDNLIERVSRRWIQIHSTETPSGLFDYTLDTAFMHKIRRQIKQNTSYEELLEILFRHFWERTETNLNIVRNKLESEFKPAIGHTFDTLQTDLAHQLQEVKVPGLDAAIAQARTILYQEIDRVKEWFRRAHPSEKPNLDLRVIIDIALKSTNNCFRYMPISPDIELEGYPVIKGDALASFVEVLFIFFSNVTQRSGHVDTAPRVSVRAKSLPGSVIHIEIENSVRFENEQERGAAYERAERARQQGVDADQTLVVTEGGTGLAKVRKTLKHDLKCPFNLDARYVDGEWFLVTLKLEAEGVIVAS